MTDARATQVAVEKWLQPTAVAQVTQIGTEMWGAVAAGPRLALATQLGLEQWAATSLPPAAVYQTAVAINTG